MKKKRKGVIPLFLTFVMLSVFLVVLFGMVIPILIQMDVSMYSAGQLALNMSLDSVDGISDPVVRESLRESISASSDSIPDQVSVMTAFHRYSWVIILIVLLFIIFMETRKDVERELV